MTILEILAAARRHLGGAMESSARLALADAVRLYEAGDIVGAKARALVSLRYTVGVFHPDYRAAL